MKHERRYAGALILMIVIIPPISLNYISYAASQTFYALATMPVGIIILLQIILLWEVIYSLSLTSERVKKPKLVDTTTIISAQLNNEQHIILDTLAANLPTLLQNDRDEVILAYRCVGNLPEETQLNQLARKTPNLTILKITCGIGKSDQMNEAVKLANNKTINFLDADAIVRPESHFEEDVFIDGIDFYFSQGTNLIRNKDSILAKIISIEYVIKYLVSQYSRHAALGLTYFCGSNGVWSREVVKRLGFSHFSLVEDVEISLRADITNLTGIFFPALITTELAPNRFVDWWHQRRRWAHGWFEAGAVHFSDLLKNPIPVIKKMNWVYLIWLRRGLYATVYYWCLVYVAITLIFGNSAPAIYFAIFLVWQWLLSALQALVSMRQVGIVLGEKLSTSSMILYIIAFPIYDAMKNLVTLAGWASWMSGNREWRITPRR